MPVMTRHLAIGAEALSKAQILSLHKAPLYGVEGAIVADGNVTITGILLAPDGDPDKVWLETDPGVEFSWHYPLAHPGAEAFYWYWPLNALYDRVSPGGWVIIDDYCVVPECRLALEDFLENRKWQPKLLPIDGVGVYLQKNGP